MAFSQHQQQRRRNAVRFELQDDLEMDRLDFSRKVLQEELGFNPQQIDYLFALPGKKVFEVIFATLDFFDHCLDRFRRKKDNPRLQKIILIPLSERDAKTVTIIMYSENVTVNDIETWLKLKCDVQRYLEVVDRDGIKTGERRFFVKLKRDLTSGQLQHLPSTIQLGRVRGNCFYQGQPKACRKCGSLSHLAAECSSNYCRHCKTASHTTRDCDQPMRCNLCGASSHTFKMCPKSYANITRQRTANPWSYTGDDTEPETAQQGPQQEEAATSDQPAEPAQDVQGNTPSADPPTAAAEEATGEPEQSTLPGHTAVLDWSDPPECEDMDSDSTADEDDAGGGTSDVDNLSNDTQLDLPVRLANSTAICASDCRDRLDNLLAEIPTPPRTSSDTAQPTPDGDNQPPPSSQKRLQQDSAEESIVLDTQVFTDMFSSSVPFLDAQSLSAFSTATQMSVAGEGKTWQHKKPRKRRRKDKVHPRASPSPVPDPLVIDPPTNV